MSEQIEEASAATNELGTPWAADCTEVADQAGLAAMIDEDDAMEAEPRRDGKRVRRATLGEAQVSLAISGLGS